MPKQMTHLLFSQHTLWKWIRVRQSNTSK